MKVAICEDYPAWGLKEDTVAWVLILTQGRTEDMGSVSNQEFPGWVTKQDALVDGFYFLKDD